MRLSRPSCRGIKLHTGQEQGGLSRWFHRQGCADLITAIPHLRLCVLFFLPVLPVLIVVLATWFLLRADRRRLWDQRMACLPGRSWRSVTRPVEQAGPMPFPTYADGPGGTGMLIFTPAIRRT